ncbi:MAG: RidA family protein [Ferruginibacter sp.]
MAKKIIKTDDAPAPIGPYNQAVIAGNLLFISGQIALIPGTPDLNNADITAETNQVMKNLQAILAAASANFNQVVKTTIFLSDMNLFTQVNEIYGQFFDDSYPARETVAVKGLPKNVNVEISMIASI